MKIWYGYGSEHSMNLVMIGSFKDTNDAYETKKVIEKITVQAEVDRDNKLYDVGNASDRYSDDMLTTLMNARINTVSTAELEQFFYDVSVESKANQIIIKTDEIDISAFLKILLEKGAKVEVYSAHDYPKEEQSLD